MKLKSIYKALIGLMNTIRKNPQVRNAVNTAADTSMKVGGKVVDKASDCLDSMSGQKIYDVVQERLAVQDQYNDVLASKLHEALQRIEALEVVVNGKK